MPPAAMIGLQLLEVAITEEPAVAAELSTLFAKGIPTAADFAAFRARVASESYAEFVPNSALPLDSLKIQNP